MSIDFDNQVKRVGFCSECGAVVAHEAAEKHISWHLEDKYSAQRREALGINDTPDVLTREHHS